jgi:hypothetical protein
LGYWQKRLAATVTYPLIVASGTAYVTGTNTTVVSGTLSEGTYLVTAELTTGTGNGATFDPCFTFASDIGTTGTYCGVNGPAGTPDNWTDGNGDDSAAGASVVESFVGEMVHTPGGAYVGSVIGNVAGQTEADFVIEQLGAQ